MSEHARRARFWHVGRFNGGWAPVEPHLNCICGQPWICVYALEELLNNDEVTT